MKTHLWKKCSLFVVLLPLLWGCGGSVGGIRQDVLACQGQDMAVGEGSVPVSILVGGGVAASRTIAPEHLTPDDLGDTSKYTLTMDGHSDMGGSVTVPNFILRGGRGILALSPGAWTLRLTATDVATSTQLLSGSTLLIVQDAPTTASITLMPLTGTGTVNVQFTIPQSVVRRLDQTNGQRQVTVALYNQQNQVVQGTSRTFPVAAGAMNPVPISYTVNGPVASGRYTLRLAAPYTVNNASTGNQNVTYNLGWSDILYVEQGRESVAQVDIPEAGTAMGVPGNPFRQDKASQRGSSATVNFVTSTTFNPWGETLWLFGANWDGNGSDLNGNEILVVSWTPVYDADYYELELLVHPFTNRITPANRYGKFNKVVATDAEWDALRQRSFTTSGQSRGTSYMRFSGGTGDPDYYKTRTYTINCADGTTRVVNNFVSCADKALARRLFATGAQNFSYRVAQATDAFDSYGTFSYNGAPMGKVGLEGDCGVLGVLIPAFSPQMSVVYRLRAVNRFGHSDWVYWKGGKW